MEFFNRFSTYIEKDARSLLIKDEEIQKVNIDNIHSLKQCNNLSNSLKENLMYIYQQNSQLLADNSEFKALAGSAEANQLIIPEQTKSLLQKDYTLIQPAPGITEKNIKFPIKEYKK